MREWQFDMEIGRKRKKGGNVGAKRDDESKESTGG